MVTADGTEASGAATPAERVVARLRPHARVLFWPAVLLIADAGAVGYFAGAFDRSWQNLAIWAGGALIALLFFVLPLVSWLSKRYTITTRRLILHRGFFVRVRQELLHSRGYDVSLSRTWLQSLFRSGDVRINAGLDAPVRLIDVPHADLVQRVLEDLGESSQSIIAERRRQQEAVEPPRTTAWGVS